MLISLCNTGGGKPLISGRNGQNSCDSTVIGDGHLWGPKENALEPFGSSANLGSKK